jgi:hypothetical protein
MTGSNRTKVIAYMVENPLLLRGCKIIELQRKVTVAIGIEAPLSTLGGLRRDLGWPPLQVKASFKADARIAKLEETLSYIVTQLNIDLPERLK